MSEPYIAGYAVKPLILECKNVQSGDPIVVEFPLYQQLERLGLVTRESPHPQLTDEEFMAKMQEEREQAFATQRRHMQERASKMKTDSALAKDQAKPELRNTLPPAKAKKIQGHAKPNQPADHADKPIETSTQEWLEDLESR